MFNIGTGTSRTCQGRTRREILQVGGIGVFVSERLTAEGDRDLYLYDRAAGKLLPTPGLNSKAEDFDPCVIVLKE